MKKYLKDVTLLAYETRPENTNNVILSLQKCCESLDFYEVKLISDVKPNNLPDGIIWEYAPHINEINDFNRYMFLEVYKHVKSSHMLYVHDHSYILNYDLWDDNWLEWDYIGCPWKLMPDAYICHATGEHVRNGNGGFSLKSYKIMSLPKEKGWELRQEQSYYNEDGNYCVYWRKEMLENGIKYAPVEVAARFAFENVVPENIGIKPFGFHRNLPPW